MPASIISIVMVTYNRAHTLPRAIDSVLAQDFQNWELVIVDDGSTDNTREVLAGYADSRIKTVFHERNSGVCAAKNTGFDHMSREWFTTLDSDDEMVPEALSTMLAVLENIDPAINAITCNCIDTTTGDYAGKGLEHDQWLDFETMVTKCSGEHWGITKSSLLGDMRFNEKISGGESIVWYRISQKARRYYIHKALRIYHTEGDDRICQSAKAIDIDKRCAFYREISKELDYLELLRKYRPADYAATMFNISLIHTMEGRSGDALKAYNDCKSYLPVTRQAALLAARLIGPRAARAIVRLLVRLR